MIIVLVLLLAVAAVIAVPLLMLARRRREGRGNSVAEFVTYLILVVATITATSSFASLVESILPGDGVLFLAPDDLALTLSTLIVSGAVWASVWTALERRRAASVSTGRGLYLSLSISAAVSVTAIALVQLLSFLFGVADYEVGAVARLLCFGALWGLLERWRSEADPLDEVRQFWGSVLGLGITSAAIGFAVHGSVEALTESRPVLLGDSSLSIDLRWAAILALVGVPLFVFFWLGRLAKSEGALRNVYAALVSAIGWLSAAIALIGGGFVIAAWLLDLSSDLVGLAPLTATFIVGGLAYWHHREVMGNERIEPVKALEYFLGAASLVSFAGWLIFLIGLVVSSFGGSVLVDDPETFLAGVIGVILTGAFTIRYWGRVVGLEEPNSPSRRAALMILFFGSAVTAAIALITVLFVLLRSALSGDTEDLFRPLAWAIPTLLVAGALGWHTIRLRRQLTPTVSADPTAAPAKSTELVVTVVATDPGPLTGMIDKMRFLRRNDGVGVVDHAQAEAIVARLNGLEARAALVTVSEADFSVVPLA